VLGRSEFKQLLRWRLGLRRDLKSLLGGGAAAAEDAKKGSHKKQQQQQDGEEDEEEGGEQEDAETKLLAEMEAIKDAAEKR
jgi:AdoMet-dependent rRNA methyltransferase SPB1